MAAEDVKKKGLLEDSKAKASMEPNGNKNQEGYLGGAQQGLIKDLVGSENYIYGSSIWPHELNGPRSQSTAYSVPDVLGCVEALCSTYEEAALETSRINVKRSGGKKLNMFGLPERSIWWLQGSLHRASLRIQESYDEGYREYMDAFRKGDRKL